MINNNMSREMDILTINSFNYEKFKRTNINKLWRL